MAVPLFSHQLVEKKKRINGKKKGNAYELKVIQDLKELYPEAVSSRSESKRADDAGIDIMYTNNLQIQCKAVEQSINTHKILSGMPKNGKMNLIFHKRNRQGETVTLSKEDFLQLLQHYPDK